MSPALADSIRLCQLLARRTGKNFYWSFLTLPRPMRQDMCVLYAFMRVTDDLGDTPEASIADRRLDLRVWRTMLRQVETDPHSGYQQLIASARQVPGVNWDKNDSVFLHTTACVLMAMGDLIARRGIPVALLHDVITGVESDLAQRRFATFAEVERYCYHVAGAVGLCCIHIWGFQGDEARSLAIDCGTAFQFTNILRDLGEDARQGRVYLPNEELQRFKVSEEDFRLGTLTPPLRALIAEQVRRTQALYLRATELLPLLSRPGQRILAAMFGIYGGLLDEIERLEYDVFSSRVELSRSRKLRAAFQGWLCPGRVARSIGERYNAKVE